jgi:hypothetical protein
MTKINRGIIEIECEFVRITEEELSVAAEQLAAGVNEGDRLAVGGGCDKSNTYHTIIQ